MAYGNVDLRWENLFEKELSYLCLRYKAAKDRAKEMLTETDNALNNLYDCGGRCITQEQAICYNYIPRGSSLKDFKIDLQVFKHNVMDKQAELKNLISNLTSTVNSVIDNFDEIDLNIYTLKKLDIIIKLIDRVDLYE